MPPEDVIEQIMNLYETIFQTSSENIRNKMQKVDRLLVLVALDNGKVVVDINKVQMSSTAGLAGATARIAGRGLARH
ncbi:hypothetical protein [Saccharococcus caldoxylosilyticus]|uniref:Uncharacterized protein n=1 Tax=Parageobacillus caldoxylosilyticus NBRC 107762 TaxID=1220594 RepID=A0A023DK30_9BACL|nr:hypothetical protein [Parageobacillus caldoxylosilyticus]MBB3854476.1 hypothetical protein [Parageobacillus caldoxylosilyticus]GAJ41619.1 hypothetical protein GCA01S_080_00040 [Parageobacillus caldoxylosilyticus NBRC 107762]